MGSYTWLLQPRMQVMGLYLSNPPHEGRRPGVREAVREDGLCFGCRRMSSPFLACQIEIEPTRRLSVFPSPCPLSPINQTAVTRSFGIQGCIYGEGVSTFDRYRSSNVFNAFEAISDHYFPHLTRISVSKLLGSSAIYRLSYLLVDFGHQQHRLAFSIRGARKFPSLLHTASRLSEVRVERCTSINDILWCWITSCRPSTSGPPILPDNEFPIPHLTIKDGITIKKLVRLCMPGYVTCNWKRSYNSELNICKLFSKFLSILVCLFFFREFERRG